MDSFKERIQQAYDFFAEHHPLIIKGSIIATSVLIVGSLAFGAITSSRHIMVEANGQVREKPQHILSRIEDGIALLKSSEPLQYETSNGRLDGPITKRQVALAVLDLRTDDVVEYRYWAYEGAIDRFFGSPGLHLEPVANAHGVYAPKVDVRWYNGYNSYYAFPNDPQLIVVGNKYLTKRETLRSTILLSVDGPVSPYTDLVYAPYSQQLHWDEVINEGRDYLDNVIDQAISELNDDGVISRAHPDKRVTDVVRKRMLKNISAIEFSDTSKFLASDDGGRTVVERYLVLLGANKEWAFRYSGSSANANGIAQFIEPTYNSMVDLYPDAHLITDYEIGMDDHVNAFKAMILFLDHHEKFLADNIAEDKLLYGISEEMLAATYNGGPGRAINAVNSRGNDWASSSALPRETRLYVKKYQLIDELDVF